jgi:hypothetical protein
MSRLVIASALFVSLAVGQTARAACISVPLERYLLHPDVAAIFRGTVVEAIPVTYALPEGFGPAPGQVAKVRVAGVWKGDVHRDTILYFREGEGDRLLEVGREYLVIASVLSAVGRQQFGLSAEGEEGLSAAELGCGAIPFESPTAQNMLGNRPSQPPR